MKYEIGQKLILKRNNIHQLVTIINKTATGYTVTSELKGRTLTRVNEADMQTVAEYAAK
jgi:hypothetical protein